MTVSESSGVHVGQALADSDGSRVGAVTDLLSTADIDIYRTEGVVVVRGLADEVWCERLGQAVEQNLADPGPWATDYSGRGPESGFHDDYCNWERFDEFRDFVFHSPAAEVAGRLMESPIVRFNHEHVLVKEPGTTEASPWHHDQPYYCIDGDQVCSIWLTLDPVSRAVCPEYVAGSHRGPYYLPRQFVDHGSYAGYGDAYPSVPDIEAHRDDYVIRSWDLEPGDAIAFHMRTLHAAPGTAGWPHRRRAIATRWTGADAVYAVRPGATSPPMEWLDLAPGDPLEHDRLPVVWTTDQRV
jgi:ectoine hydroxylase-related dioxygenase (phytanoyl-CoA dioxygenase family)